MLDLYAQVPVDGDARFRGLIRRNDDQSGNALVNTRAREPGPHIPPLQVVTSVAHLLTAKLYKADATYTAIPSGRDVMLTAKDGSKFRPGDVVLLEGSKQAVQVLRVGSDTLRLADDLIPPPNPQNLPAKIFLANTTPGTQTVRIDAGGILPPGVLVPGTMLTITQIPKNQNDPTVSDTQMVDSVQVELGSQTTYRTTFRNALKAGFSLDPADPAASVESQEFAAVISLQGGPVITTYNNLSIDPAHPRYYLEAINNSDGLITVQPVQPPPSSAPPANLPATTGPNATTLFTDGKAEVLTTIVDSNFTDALDTLTQVPDVNLVAVPGIGSPAVLQAVIDHCEQMGDRFGVLDPKPGSPLFNDANSIEKQRQGADSTRGYAALYYPWLMVPPVGAGAPIPVPPSGHVCGIMARVDNTRGVHKAPANEIVNGALDVERTMSDQDQGILNLEGINVIRVFRAGGRPIVWGARTTVTDTNWQYVNIRRLFLFLEKSIQEGIRWAVFEPNNTGLWEKLRRTITDFLTRVWRDGGLFGETADKAFYVRIDETLNPDSERALGRLHIEIGVRPSYPAEFIIVRIGIWYGGSQVTEG